MATIYKGDNLPNKISVPAGLPDRWAVEIYGEGGNDELSGGLSTLNSIYGGDGDDLMRGGVYADAFDGGAGTDTVSYAGSTTGVAADLGVGGYAGDATGDSYTSVEYLIGSGFNDVLVGKPGVANRLVGGAGDDVIYGEGLDAGLNLGPGAVIPPGYVGPPGVSGGPGNDVFFGGQGGGFKLDLAATEFETVWGSFESDNMQGGNATWSLTLIGQGPSADWMSGGWGDDFIYFRAGDLIWGNSGYDWAVATLSPAGVNRELYDGMFEAAWGSRFDDVLTVGLSATWGGVLVGDAGNDTLTGGSQADFIYGFGDNDRLDGRGGADILDGGQGADIFVFTGFNYPSPAWQADQIFYFESGVDRLEFAGAGNAPLIPGLNFITGSAPASVANMQTFLYNTSSGLLFWDPDGKPLAGAPVDNPAVLVAQFYQAPALAAADFILL